MRHILIISICLIFCLSCSKTTTREETRKSYQSGNTSKPNSQFEFSKDFYEWPVKDASKTDTTFDFSYPNYPDPFGPSLSKFQYTLPQPCDVTIDIFNVSQEKLGTLELGHKKPGTYGCGWRATNAPGGVYFVTFRACDFTKNIRFTLLK